MSRAFRVVSAGDTDPADSLAELLRLVGCEVCARPVSGLTLGTYHLVLMDTRVLFPIRP